MLRLSADRTGPLNSFYLIENQITLIRIDFLVD